MFKLEVRLMLVFCLASVLQASHTKKGKNKGWDDCPNSEEILPCTCNWNYLIDSLTISCSNAKSEEEIRTAFSANFINKEFDSFRIDWNEEIKVLESNVFNGVAFKEFYLNHNVIEKVDIKVFEDSSEIIDNINLQSNQITQISLESEKDFPTLRRIYLSRNNLTEIPFELLKDFPNLSTFDVDYNPLGTIPVDSFQETSLSTLSLSGTVNGFTVGTFSNQTRLSWLWVSHNNLNHIPSGLFVTGSSHFSLIFLSGNGIVSIEPNAFDLNRGLLIHMMDNSITTIEESVWREPFEAGVELDLSDDNPLECGCNVAWIVNDPALKQQVSEYTECSDGRSFKDLLPDDFVDC